jgi:hypothetical protein
MISEVDLQDWEMITTPVKLDKLKEGDMFSLFGDNRIYKVQHVLLDIAYAETKEFWTSLVFPRSMEVFPWVSKQKESQLNTNN